MSRATISLPAPDQYYAIKGMCLKVFGKWRAPVVSTPLPAFHFF